MVLRALFGLLLVAVLALAGFALWARQSAIAPIAPPLTSSFDKASIAKGAILAAMGNCGECHSVRGGQPFSGGYPVPTPFGTIYGTNITPDPQTGIGRWSEAAFLRAMRKGVGRSGDYLYPAFPYPHFTRMSDEDVKAIYAYLMTRPPAHNTVPPPQLPFPWNIRLIMAGWNLLFLDDSRFKPDPNQSSDWNRGAYIAEGLGHCNSCHGPLNWFGAEIRQKRWAGGRSEGWDAPALNQTSPAPSPWSKGQLETYLAGGLAQDHGMAAGPMAGISHDLEQLPASDLTALAKYIGSLGRPASADETKAATGAADQAEFRLATVLANTEASPAAAAEQIFAGACASCHLMGGGQPLQRPVELGLSSAVNAPEPGNFIHIVMDGIEPPPGRQGPIMPPFGGALTDEQLTSLAGYIRGRFGRKPAWNDFAKTVGEIREGKGP